jgi:glutamyl-tRNA synthetase
MMLDGKYGEGQAVIRLKTDIKDPNPAFRDRVLLRVSEREHPKVGRKYKVWPMLEFSWAVDDHLFGMTHILRGKDLVIEDLMEMYIWDVFGWKHPEILHYGLLGIKNLKLSKSKSSKAIADGEYSGWDDPRTWSLQSLRKRGIRPEAIRAFILNFGMSMNDITVPADVLYSENRKIIEPVSDRYFAVFDPVPIKVEGAPDVSEAVEDRHPDFKDKGKRRVPVDTGKVLISKRDFEANKGKIVRLIGLFNVELGEKVRYHGNEIVQEMPKIQWVSKDTVPVKVVMEDGSVMEGFAEPETIKKR